VNVGKLFFILAKAGHGGMPACFLTTIKITFGINDDCDMGMMMTSFYVPVLIDRYFNATR
jgi:hypothetical protein